MGRLETQRTQRGLWPQPHLFVLVVALSATFDDEGEEADDEA